MQIDQSPPVIDIDNVELFRRLEAGHHLVTANNRLSRITRDRYARYRQSRGDLCWPTPFVFSFEMWLEQLWEESALRGLPGTDKTVPGNLQLDQLWHSAIRNSAIGSPLMHTGTMARQLRETRALVKEWQLDLNSREWLSADNENVRAFRAWNHQFEEICREGGWLPPEDRYAVLANLAAEHPLLEAAAIDLLGFDELNPAQLGLLSAFMGGVEVSLLQQSPLGRPARRWQAEDPGSELDRMARWARFWLETEPESDIALIVPDLSQRAGEVEYALRNILFPQGRPDESHKPWNISLGEPLADQAMIRSAFDVLGLLEFTFDIREASAVLRSPWIRGGRGEQDQRALLEQCLRRKYSRQLNLYELHYRSREKIRFDEDRREIPEADQQPQPWNSPVFSQLVQNLITFNARHVTAEPPSVWAENLDGLLASLGWPLSGSTNAGEESSRDWQVLQAWRKALVELASLDGLRPPLRRREAVRLLREICRQTVFQVKSPNCKLQVLGLYEASGLQFDHAWVVGLHHGNWPRAARPNPFVPRALQIDRGIPRSDSRREYEVARAVTGRLIDCAGDVIFSSPVRIDDEPSLPSPLLLHLPLIDTPELPQWTEENWPQRIAKAAGVITVMTEMPGPVADSDPRGGSRILRNQALCPFRAFAENRLQAEPLEAPSRGIGAAQHGALLHKALESFWRETRSHDALVSMDFPRLKSRAEEHIQAAIDEDRGLRNRAAFRQVEFARLKRHILAFIELEKKRSPFEAVGFEVELDLEIEGQPVRLIIDRIDELEDGGRAIIDYKSGKVSAAKWFGERPEDPQLPLYAISENETPAAVVLAVIREDGCLFKGVTRSDGLFPGLPSRTGKSNQRLLEAGQQLPLTIRQWRAILENLMRSFLAGEARVEPKNDRKTCGDSYCALRSLCRIDELAPHSGLGEDTDL